VSAEQDAAGERPERLPADCRERVEQLLLRPGRQVLGLAGAPGGGKSTLARLIQAQWPEISVVVPMDGFHLAQSELLRLGRAQRKGAPDTFDASGYVNLLRRLRDPASETVYAPEFRREIEEPVAGAIAVAAGVKLVVTEGNYLLLDDPVWSAVRPLLNETWYLGGDEELRQQRLVLRHMQHGRNRQQALDWVRENDEVNARLIASSAANADWFCLWHGRATDRTSA